MTKVQVTELHVGERFVSAKSGVTLTVAEKFAGGMTYATQDGVSFTRGVWHGVDEHGVWHENEEAESVWAEAWDMGGCQFHGCVDKVSRKVTQVG